MDDTAPQSGVSQVPQGQQQAVQQPVNIVQGQQPVQQIPVESAQQPQPQVSIPVGGKEHEAAALIDAQPSHPEVALEQEVQEAGVETVPTEELKLEQEHKDAGIEPAKEATPLPQGPTTIQLPDEYRPPAGLGLLHQNVKKAATWLWLLLFRSQKQSERATQTQLKK